MKKINKIANIALIFMLIIFTYIDFAYPLSCNLRIPLQNLNRFKQILEKARKGSARKTISLPGIRSDDYRYLNEKLEYLDHLNGDFPEAIANLKHSLDWPVNIRLVGYLWHFHGSLYCLIGLSPRHHLGIDILFAEDRDEDRDIEIRAVLDGNIIDILQYGERAYGILVRSKEGIVCCYHHIAAKQEYKEGEHFVRYKPSWEIGQKIKTGELIGTVAWCPRPLWDYKVFDKRPALPFKSITLATRLHFQTWYFSPHISDGKVAKHINDKLLQDEGDENEFNPLLLLKPLYTIPPFLNLDRNRSVESGL